MSHRCQSRSRGGRAQWSDGARANLCLGPPSREYALCGAAPNGFLRFQTKVLDPGT
jgi:hypothetical protein